ncbi:MAG: hypothetical protein Tp1124DCM412911_33 [Prokaryotic dsDNA virus sp.]|nr:MAG: hypothetical protein Tp1124DCM412911_33 [Prokaryotic dsDNA virus sp.]|tara:strand:- start:9081 stop:9323 length:243 start_codon:yes stop_codon:yes gene_type:complete
MDMNKLANEVAGPKQVKRDKLVPMVFDPGSGTLISVDDCELVLVDAEDTDNPKEAAASATFTMPMRRILELAGLPVWKGK